MFNVHGHFSLMMKIYCGKFLIVIANAIHKSDIICYEIILHITFYKKKILFRASSLLHHNSNKLDVAYTSNTMYGVRVKQIQMDIVCLSIQV